MRVKWIVCHVIGRLKNEFSLAQEKWADIKDAPGLVGQIGGWDLKSENTACILGFWEDEASLKFFMEHLHDKITSANHQSQYCSSIEVGHFNTLLTMEGACRHLTGALKKAKLLRIADCQVKKEKTAHFEKVQKEVWLPGIQKAQGMLGGKFSRGMPTAESRYLVSTLWNSEDDHASYVEADLLRLRINSDVKNDLAHMVGRQVLLVDAWKVLKDGSTF